MLYASELGRPEFQCGLGPINVLNELRAMSINFAPCGVSAVWIQLLNLQAHWQPAPRYHRKMQQGSGWKRAMRLTPAWSPRPQRPVVLARRL